MFWDNFASPAMVHETQEFFHSVVILSNSFPEIRGDVVMARRLSSFQFRHNSLQFLPCEFRRFNGDHVPLWFDVCRCQLWVHRLPLHFLEIFCEGLGPCTRINEFAFQVADARVLDNPPAPECFHRSPTATCQRLKQPSFHVMPSGPPY